MAAAAHLACSGFVVYVHASNNADAMWPQCAHCARRRDALGQLNLMHLAAESDAAVLCINHQPLLEAE